MNETKLGQLIDANAGRDAVHIALAPVVAYEKLLPGEHVGFVDPNDTTLAGSAHSCDKCIGIVDPYLKSDVQKGERFFMCLYPQTTTGLRHVWTHPAFTQLPDPIDKSSCPDSEIWLRAYAMRLSPYDTPQVAYENLVSGLKSHEIFAHGRDLHGLYELDDSDELKRHAENALGIRINWGMFSFSCSC